MIILAAALPPGSVELGRLGYYLAMDALYRIRLQQEGPQGGVPLVKEALGVVHGLETLGVAPHRCVTPLEESAVRQALAPDGLVRLEPWLPRVRAWLTGLTLPGWLDEVAAPLWGEVAPFPLPRLPAYVGPGLEVETCWAFDREQAWHYLSVMPALQLALRPAMPLPRALLASREQSPSVPLEVARQFLSSDFLRLNLAAERLSLGDLAERAEPFWEEWITLVLDWAQGRAPAAQGLTALEGEFRDELERLAEVAEEHRRPETFSLSRQVQVLDELVLRSQRFAELHVHSGSDTALALALGSLGLFARLALPIMPDLGEALRPIPGGKVPTELSYTFPNRAQVAALVASRLKP